MRKEQKYVVVCWDRATLALQTQKVQESQCTAADGLPAQSPV